MIVASIGMVILAAVLLIVGLVRTSDLLFYGSIAASALAAIALVIGVRRAASATGRDAAAAARPDTEARTAAPRPVGRARVPVPAAGSGRGAPDEPGVQALSDSQAGRLARLVGELKHVVVVVDGRPRYHLAECLHLLGRDVQRLPAAEAIELGFTPCGRCEPATALLASVPRV